MMATQEKAQRPRAKRFVPPTLEMVAAYIEEKGYHFDARDYIAHYTSNGWKVGKALAPMQCWRSACWTFESVWRERHPGYREPQTQPPLLRQDWENASDRIRDLRWRWACGERITEQEFNELMSWMEGKS